MTWGREESRAEVGVHVGQEGIEDAPVASPVGHHWLVTHLQGILFLPAAPMEEEKEEERGSEQNREGAFQGASHGPCWLRPGERGHVRAQPRESHHPWMGQWDSTWIHPWDCPPAPNTHRWTPGSSHGASGDTSAVPFGQAGTGTSQPDQDNISQVQNSPKPAPGHLSCPGTPQAAPWSWRQKKCR